MKGIFIDVVNQTISYVTIGNGIQPIYDTIGCSTFECVDVDNKNTIYCDEEGLLNLDSNSKFFKIDNYPQPISGNGLILGFDDETGESTDTSLSVMDLVTRIRFMDIYQVQMFSRLGVFS
jgi:hypothetical protein